MSWRTVVVTGSAKLDFQLGYLVVRKAEVSKIHISEISMLIIDSTSVSITAMLLCELVKKKVKVIFCDEKRNPISELCSYYGSHDTSEKIRKQVKWNDRTRATVWTEIVCEKIRKQAEYLSELDKYATEMLYRYIDEVQLGDVTNREGHAAKVYFNVLFGMNFTRDEDNSINAALNYGYSILCSSFAKEIVSAGYITQIGLFHDNMFNQFNLASDLMEPFRPLIDRKVRLLMPDKFEHDEKMYMLGFLDDIVNIAGRKETVRNAIKIYCHGVLEALDSSDIGFIQFYRNEL